MNIILSVIIGGISGWLAGKLIKGEGYGTVVNIILGLVGGAFGTFVISLLGFSSGDGFVPRIITAVIGATLIIWIYKKWVKPQIL